MTEETVALEGLAAPAEILIDPWGIPHIRAENEDDLFFAQGFNAARDRLWQIDLWRKKGLGLLAADHGPGFLAQDYAARLFLFDGDMAAEWAAYAADDENPERPREICERFAAGVNAFVALTEREPQRLPPEFHALDVRPAYWRAADIVRIRAHAIAQNAVSEILRAKNFAAGASDLDAFRRALNPRVAPLWDGADAPLAAIDGLRLASAHPTFSKERRAARLEEAWDWCGVDEYGEVVRRADAKPPRPVEEGSNNWAVGPQRSATGRPILANDPHRVLRNPSLRYLAHLTAPGLDVIGAGEPFLPGLSIGHNGMTAFGLTIFYIDQEDVYRLALREGGDAYVHEGGAKPFVKKRWRFEVKGAPAQMLVAKFSHHGPVVCEEDGQAYAIRSVWALPGAAPYARSLAAMRARDVDDFRARVRAWGTPAVNHVSADISGNIAWTPSGFWPDRVPGHDGLTPVSGGGAFEWRGLRDCETLPRVKNPAAGVLATANEMNLPRDFAAVVGYEWIDDARAERIAEFFASRARVSLSDCCALQTDVHSLHARALMAVVGSLRPTSDCAAPLALLRGWNAVLDRDGAAAAFYGLWWTRHARPALLDALGAEPAVRKRLAPGDVAALIAALEADDPRLNAAVVLPRTLAAAWKEAKALWGVDPRAWRWGDAHVMRFDHALRAVADLPPAAPPLPMAGDVSSVMHMAYRADDFSIVTGASVRLVIDVGDWDKSLAINAPGQAGDPRSPHYGDLAPLWSQGGYVPLLYSREAVDEVAQTRLRLTPA